MKLALKVSALVMTFFGAAVVIFKLPILRLIAGRVPVTFMIPEDVKSVGRDALRHRVLVTYEAEAEELTSDDIVASLLDHIEVP